MRSSVPLVMAVLVGVLVAGSNVGEGAVGTVFTYQGRLNAAGSPVSAAADFRFSLWTAVSGGSQVGTTQTLTGVELQNGFFTVELDFGAAAFNGDARWLAIEARHPAGAGSYQALSPRQPVRTTPYAMTALKALEAASSTSMPWSGLSGLPAGFADNTDNDTLYSAGAGLTLAGTTFAIGAGGVATAMLADSAVTAAKLANSAVTSAKLADSAVGQGKLSALGGVAGQVLGTDGANLLWIWQTGGGSLILPYAGEYTGAGTAFAISSTVGEAILGQSVDGVGVFGRSTNSYAGQFDGHVLVQGRGGFDSLGDMATLYLGKEPHYIRSEWGQGVRIGSYQAADAIALQQVTGNVGLGTTTPQARLDVNGNLIVRGFRTRLEGADFEIAHAPRGDGGRALVHEGNGTEERLVVNFENDFANGTRIDGNLGIGTNPQARLDVAGRVNVSAQETSMPALKVSQVGTGVALEASAYDTDASDGLAGTGAIVYFLYPPAVSVFNYGALAAPNLGVYGELNETTGGGAGVWGVSNVTDGRGVLGEANLGANAAGVYGFSDSGSGVVGASNSGHAGRFEGRVNVSANTHGLLTALNVIQTGAGLGAYVEAPGVASSAPALVARLGPNIPGALDSQAESAAIDAVTSHPGWPKGIVATAYDTDASNGLRGCGVWGKYGSSAWGGLQNVGGLGTPTDGVYGEQNYTSSAGTGSFPYGAGVYGVSTIQNGVGVFGEANDGPFAFGVYGYSTSGYAGFFSGNVHVNGALDAASKLFKIDHPLDPENKYLSHASVESAEMKTLYDGVVVTDARGYATIELPAWFEALNGDFRYQLTVVDDADSEDWVLAKVTKEIADSRFTIRTSAPETKVCWQVSGVRRDAWAVAHPLVVEQEKTDVERSLAVPPAARGVPEENAILGGRERPLPTTS